MEFRLNTPVPDTINFQLKDQACALYPHVECEVQIVEFDAFGGCQARKQALWHSVEIGGECAHIDKTFSEGVWRGIHITSNQVVFDDQRLTRPEVACVMERYRLVR